MEKRLLKLSGILMIVLGIVGFAISVAYAIITQGWIISQGIYGILPIAVILVLIGLVIYKRGIILKSVN